MVLDSTVPTRKDEIEGLYRRLSGRLEQIVRGDVHAPAPLIEDACQVAWGRLVAHHDRVRVETALGWLAATATHEAFRLLRRDRREPSLEAAIEIAAVGTIAAAAPGTHELAEQHERIAELGRLPACQQRVVWLQALGLSYAEMAAHEACTPRTVERRLYRAKRSLRERTA